jgi:hypothetical protein
MTDDERELRPAGRHEWEQILGRMRVTGVLGGRRGKDGRHTKGAVSALAFKAVAARFAHYGDGDGSRIWPGDAAVAVDLETTVDRVRVVRQALVRMGLLELVRSRRGDRGEEYRLTLPTDILETVEVLTPAQHKLAAHLMREARRGPTKKASEPDSGGPLDNPSEEPGWSGGQPESETLGSPADHPDDGAGESTGPPKLASGWSSGLRSGGPPDTHTNQDQPHPLPTTPTSGVRTAVTVSRGSQAVQDPNFDVVGESDPSGRDGPCEHGMPPLIRCPACRRGLRTLRPVADPPESESEHLADVLAFRPRTA